VKKAAKKNNIIKSYLCRSKLPLAYIFCLRPSFKAYNYSNRVPGKGLSTTAVQTKLHSMQGIINFQL